MSRPLKDSLRGTGRTRALLETIPPKGGIFIVHHPAMKLYVQTMIADLWGLERLRSICVAVHASERDAERLRGFNSYVVVDHFVWESMSYDETLRMAEVVDRCRALADMGTCG